MTVGTLLTECTNINIKDHEFCGSLGVNGAFCAHILTNQTRSMTLQEFAAWWDDLKNPKVATDLSTIMDLKADIEKLCNNTGDCSAQMEDQADSLLNKINTMNSTAAKLGR